MKSTCRAMVLTAPKTLKMQTFNIPEIKEDDGLLKVELVGVCGSDPGISEGRQTRGVRPFPIILGHEIVGRVVKMGGQAKKRLGVTEGDRVVIEYSFGCGMCDPCISGNYTLCEKNYTYGSMISCQDPPHLFGGYSEYVYIHPRAMVHKIGDDLSPEVGVLICAVLGNGIRWLRQIGGVSIGDTVAIIGPGQQGLAGVAVAKESGAGPIILLGLSQDKTRLEMGRRFGADRVMNIEEENPVEALREMSGGKMANVVMDVSGNSAGAELALSLTGRRGTIVLPGIYKGKKASLDLDQVVLREIKVQGVFSHDFRAVRPAMQMARKGRYPFHELITHRLPLEEAERALRLVGGGKKGENPLKVVLDPNLKAGS
ncbi:MAG: zinc-binding dehydrogenase [Deltaproteobacteria bacterium]|nr:zinc-binding dehydrogenase [Deltaproteobacteria bacterium]